MSMHWKEAIQLENGLLAQGFRLDVSGREVPGVLWTRHGQAGRRPLLLMSHGGSQHKLSPEVTDRAAAFVLEHGFAVAAIDGPIHGERCAVVAAGAERQAEFLEMWRRDHHIDAMVVDWKASLDALLRREEIDAQAIGWYGVSMGTAYGLPLAAIEPRIHVAVLGMWGASFPNSQRLVEDAPLVRCPVFFQQQWDDALFTRESQIALFDRLGSEQKWLKVYPGPHRVTEEQFGDAKVFLVRHLQGSSEPRHA